MGVSLLMFSNQQPGSKFVSIIPNLFANIASRLVPIRDVPNQFQKDVFMIVAVDLLFIQKAQC